MARRCVGGEIRWKVKAASLSRAILTNITRDSRRTLKSSSAVAQMYVVKDDDRR